MVMNIKQLTPLSVQQILVFSHVVDLQSFAAAARLMKVSTPTIWAQVRSIEKAYKCKFFKRVGRNVVPTQDALLLRETLQSVLNTLESSVKLINREGEGGITSLTIVTGIRMIMEELGTKLRYFHNAHPEVTLKLYHGDDMTAQEMLVEGKADLAMILEPPEDRKNSRLLFTPVYDLEYLLVLPPGHPLENMAFESLAQTVDYPFIVGHAGTYSRQSFDNALYREGLAGKLKITAETNNSALTINLVRQGLGLGVIAGISSGRLLDGLHTISLTKIFGKVRVVAVWKKGTVQPPVVNELLKIVKEPMS